MKQNINSVNRAVNNVNKSNNNKPLVKLFAIELCFEIQGLQERPSRNNNNS